MKLDLEPKYSKDDDKRVCPVCGYPHTSLKNISRKWTTSLGLVTGGLTGATALLTFTEGVEIGAGMGVAMAGPTGAILGALGGAAIGALAGHVAGHLVDRDIVGVYYCPKCFTHYLI